MRSVSNWDQVGQDQLNELLMYLVGRLGKMPRSKLVKLVYLVDERWFQLRGKTLTGLDYAFDHYGPNAEGNAIVKAGDRLAGHELSIRPQPSARGAEWYAYSLGPEPRFTPALGTDVQEIVEEVIGRYGRMTVDQIVAASKETRPFRFRPQPGERLRMVSLEVEARENLDRLRSRAAAIGAVDVREAEESEPAGGSIDRLQRRALSLGD